MAPLGSKVGFTVLWLLLGFHHAHAQQFQRPTSDITSGMYGQAGPPHHNLDNNEAPLRVSSQSLASMHEIP